MRGDRVGGGDLVVKQGERSAETCRANLIQIAAELGLGIDQAGSQLVDAFRNLVRVVLLLLRLTRC